MPWLTHSAWDGIRCPRDLSAVETNPLHGLSFCYRSQGYSHVALAGFLHVFEELYVIAASFFLA